MDVDRVAFDNLLEELQAAMTQDLVDWGEDGVSRVVYLDEEGRALPSVGEHDVARLVREWLLGSPQERTDIQTDHPGSWAVLEEADRVLLARFTTDVICAQRNYARHAARHRHGFPYDKGCDDAYRRDLVRLSRVVRRDVRRPRPSIPASCSRRVSGSRRSPRRTARAPARQADDPEPEPLVAAGAAR